MAKKKKVQDTSPLAMGRQQKGSAANKRVQKTGTNTKSQSSVSQKDRINQKSYGTTTPNVRRTTAPTSRNTSSSNKAEQRQVKPTARRTTNVPTATSRQRNTTATAAEMRRQNLGSTLEKNRDPLGMNKTKTPATAKDMMEKRQGTSASNTIKERNAAEWENVKNKSKEEQQKWFTQKAQEAQKRHNGKVDKGTDNLATSAALSAFHGGKGAVHSLYGALTRSSLQDEYETQRDKGLASLRGEDVNQAEKVARDKAQKRKELKLAGIREKTKIEQQKVEELKEKEAAKDKGPIPLRKMAVGAASFTGQRLVDTAIAGPYSLASMGARVREDELNSGIEKNEKLKKRLVESGRFTQEELDEEFKKLDKRVIANANASAAIEGLSERIFGGVGLSKKYLPEGTTGFLDNVAGKLFGKLGSSAVGKVGLGIAEETAEEWIANPLQAAVSNKLTGNRLQELQEEDVRREYQKQAMDLKEMQATSADINSQAFLERAKEIYKEAGANDKEASRIAELARDYFNADLTGDTETAEAKLNQITDILAGGENDLREKWTLRDALEVAGEMILSVGSEAAPGAFTSSMAGNDYKANYGIEGVKKLAKVVENLDTDKSDRAKAIIDDIDSGKDVTGTQVSDLMQWSNEAALKAQDREIARDDLVQKRMKNEKLFVPIVDSEYNLAPATEERFEAITDRVVDNIQDVMKLNMSDVDAYAIGDVVAAFETGTISAEQMNELNIENPEARTVFEKETDIDLGQYTVKDKSGNIKVAESNVKMQKALFSMAADNYMESARIEQENWNDTARGQAAEELAANMDGMGSIGVQRVLESVDPRNRGDFMLAGSIARRVYEHARLTNDSWDEVKKDFKNAFPNTSMDESMRYVYDMAKRSKDIAETKYYGQQVSDKHILKDADPMYVPGEFNNKSKRVPKNSELSTLTNMATTLGVNIVMEDLGNDNGSYSPSSRTIRLNSNKTMGENLQVILSHEVTHHLAAYAPDEYLKLSRFIMDKAYKTDADKFTASIKSIQKLYKERKNQNLSPEEALEEIIANNAHEFWQDENFIDDVTREEPSLAQAIINSIKDILRKIRSVLSSGNVTDENDRQFLFDEINAYDAAYKMWVNAFRVAKADQANQAINEWQDDVNAQSGSTERFSISEMDSEGHKLSEAQREFFKDSKAVDDDGNLIVFYHGTPSFGFTEFDGDGIFFTDNKDAADSYTYGDESGIYSVYLNLSNPMIIDAEGQNWDDIRAYLSEGSSNRAKEINDRLDEIRDDWRNGTDNGEYERLLDELDELEDEASGGDTESWINSAKENGHDGLIIRNLYDYGSEYEGEEYEPFTEAIAFERNQIKNIDNLNPTENDDIRYSISEQQDADYMKAVESNDMATAQKMVDEAAMAAGYTMTAYRGGKANVFEKEREGVSQVGTFFTSAEYIANAFAGGKRENVGAYYLKMDNPLTLDAEGRSYVDIPVPDNHPDKDLVAYAKDTFDGTISADDMEAWADEHGYDGVIINNVKEGIGGDAETDLIAINPEQTKSADPVTYDDNGNVIPLSQRFNAESDDVRFSLSSPVERVRDLVAVHNVKETDLPGMLELGGMPVPSIAVIKASMGHDKYGDISFLFHSDTIDPQKSRYNKVYGGDAYTPTFPAISKKISRDKAEEIGSKLKDILGIENEYKDMPAGLHFPSLDTDNLSDALNYSQPHEAFAYRRGNEAFKIAYLKDAKGMDVDVPMRTDTINGQDAEFWEEMDKIIPEVTRGEAYNMSYEEAKQYEPAIRELLNKQFAEQHPDFKGDLYKEELAYGDLTGPRGYIAGMVNYRENGFPQVVDTDALDEILKENVDEEGYNKWIDNLFDGIIEKTGLRNNKDLFTPSGNRRSWEALHDPVTIDAVVKIMRDELDQGGEGFFGANPKGAAQKSYKSLDEIIADEDRLQMLDDEEYSALTDEGLNMMADVAQSIVDSNTPGRFSKNQFGAALDVGGYIAEVLNETRNVDKMKSLFDRDYSIKVSDEQINEILAATEILAEAPTGYFEAKPKRAVGFDEVKAALVPNNMDKGLTQQLADRGVEIVEYDPEVEGDRAAKLNEVADRQDIKFSLNSEGEELSQGQEIFFERSKNRNVEGQLKVMLHGTDADFTEFDPSKARPGTLGRAFYFSDSASHAGQYGNVGRYYLNLEHPLMGETHDITKDQLRKFVAYLADNEDYGIENYGADATVDSVTDSVWGGTDFTMLRDLNLSAVGDFAEAVKVFNRVNDTDYDGIITDVETAAFYPEQIKRTDNLNPTLSKDTRYSITDSKNRELSDGQVKYFRNSQARDEQDRLVRVYHSTDSGGFTVFDPSHSDDKRSIFFTSNYRMSQSYIRGGSYKDFNAMEFALPAIESYSIMSMQDVVDYFASLSNNQKDEIGIVIYDSESNRYDSYTPATKNSSIEAFFEKYGDDFSDIEGYIEDRDGTIGKFHDKNELFNELEDCVKYINRQFGEQGRGDSGTYSCYLNLENPMIIDCKGANWDSISEDGFEQISVLKVGGSYDVVANGDTITLEEARSMFGDEMVDQIEEYDDWVSGEYHDFYTWDGAAFDPEVEGYWPAEGDTRYWCLEAEARGFDGVIFLNLSDNGSSYSYEIGDVYVAFSSNQIKDINNLNPTEHSDIRYSITPEDEVKSKMAYEYAMDDSYEALEYYEQSISDLTEEAAENRPIKKFSEDKIAEFYAGLRSADSWVHTDPIEEEDTVRMAQSKNDFFANLNAKWNDRWRTEGEVLDVKSVKKDVRNLVMGVMQNSDTNSKYKNDLVKKTLFDVRTAFQLMKQDRPDVASELLYYSAQRMIDNVEFYVDGTFDQYKDLKHYLRNTRISLGEEYWADVEYDTFRKRNSGRIKLVKGSTNVDQVYQELEEMFPEFFDSEETMDVPSQLLQMEHVLDTVQPYKEAYSSEAAAELAFDIADGLYDIMMNGDEVRSLADTYKARYDAKTKAMKQRHAEAMLRVRRARDEGIQAERQKFREYKERQKEKKLHRKEFDSIQKSYNTLKDRLMSNTADSNIPEQYKKELAGLLAAFDLQTVKSKQLEKTKMRRSQKAIKMSAIRTALRQIEVRTQQFFHVNDAITDIIDELLGVNAEYPAAASIEGKTIDELSVEELIRIDKLLKALVHEFNTYKNVRIQDRNEKAQDIADAQVTSALDHAKKFGPGTDWHGIRGGIDKVLNMDEVTPAYMFRMIDRENKGLGMMWKELERSQDKYIRNTEQLSKWMSEITGKYHNKGRFNNKYGADEIAEWRRNRSAQDFNLTNGSISLTPAQMMSLAMLANRPQAYQHMIGAGVVVAPVNFQAKLETDLKRKTNRALPLILTDADIKLIVSQLTPEQRKMAEDLQQLMANQMAEWGNEASMDVLGIRLFEEKEYFPIKSDRAALEKDLTADQFEQAIRNFGFTKAVMPGARNAIMIDDIFDVVTEHCNNMNLYNSYSKALNDFMKVYNKHTFQEDGSDYSVAQALGHAYSQKTTNFILNFVKDINGNVSRGRDTGIESLLQGQLANAKKASVFANIRVLLQQPTAITRAFAVINPKYLKGVKIEKGAMEEMFEHCPIAKWKSWGYYDINMGKNIEDIIMNEGNFLEDLATQAYGAADNVTWTAIWQMVKAEMKDTHPDVVEGSDEFWYQCNERMREIVDLTQVVDSPMHRSHAMRDKNFFVKMATSFMAEPTLTFNMVRDGYIRAKEAWDSGNKKEAASIMSKTMSVYVLQAATVAAAAAIADAIRGKKPDGGGDDEDKDFFSNWWANTLANFKDEIALWNKVYYVKDIASIFEGYEAWNLGTQGISNFVKGYSQLTKKLSEGSKTSWWNIYQNLLGGIGYMTGIPIKTLMKDGKAIFEMLGGKLPKNLVGEEKSEAVVDKDSAFGRLIAPKDKSDSKSASAVKVSEEEHWYDYGNNPLSVKDGSALDKFLNRFGVNLTGAEKAAAIQAQKDKALEEEANEIADSVADLDEEEKAKKTWSKVTTFIKDEEGRSINDLIKEGEYSIIDQYRDLFIAAGNDPDYFDERVMSASKKALKKTISYEMSDDEMYAQQEMIAYLRMGGVTDAEISEIAYKSDIAKDVKVAMRLGDEELVMEAVMPLVQAGITQEDFDKLWTNRNRIDLKKYDGRFKDQLKSTGSYTWPCQGTITSEFGRRSAPTAGASSYHQAIDIGAAAGTPVGAADGGVVVFAGWNGAAGKTVKVQHDDGTITQYSHLQWWNVKEGDAVGQGQEIGLVGSTGVSTGPHLHFGVMRNGKYVNPMDYLS